MAEFVGDEKVTLETTVPVLVTVDVIAGEVTKVQVLDEISETEDLRLVEYQKPSVTVAAYNAAVAIAETEEWPAWNFG